MFPNKVKTDVLPRSGLPFSSMSPKGERSLNRRADGVFIFPSNAPAACSKFIVSSFYRRGKSNEVKELAQGYIAHKVEPP